MSDAELKKIRAKFWRDMFLQKWLTREPFDEAGCNQREYMAADRADFALKLFDNRFSQ